ncbi:MAG TPA: class I SAM-dependent methyltransferase [Acidimicrobiales bacterium]|nr:class I SAM-dependent methyltransferase [Acidimicrobiales bacterium]
MQPDTTEWASSHHAHRYLAKQDDLPHRAEGEAVFFECLPAKVGRVLDLGTGDGRLIALVLGVHPDAEAIGVDMSPPMLEAARGRFAGNPGIRIVEHDLNDPLPDLGRFDLIVSSFAIHHLPDERKRSLYAECFDILEPGGVFLNLEHVSSPTERLRDAFLSGLGMTLEEEDKSNILLDTWTQVRWLRDIGFDDADCYWKWREFALFGGVRT